MSALERTLGPRELNRALLARQLLLERSTEGVASALARVAGQQAQYAPSMYIGLWSRVDGFRRADLTSALEQRTVVQGTLMRSTIHLVSKDDYWPFAIAVRQARRRWWLKAAATDLGDGEMAQAGDLLARRLSEGPLRRKEIEALVGKGRAAAVGLWLDLVRVPPSGTWERRRADLYAAAEEWVGPPAIGEMEAVRHLVRRYLGGFGPASLRNIADFTGLATSEVVPALSESDLRTFRDSTDDILFDLPDAPLPDPDTPAPVRFLPPWDATLLAHARRSGILPEAYRPVIFHRKNPRSSSTFLVDGAVAGVWSHSAGTIRLEPFQTLHRSIRAELDEEAQRLVELHA